jgi:hypothetical protein
MENKDCPGVIIMKKLLIFLVAVITGFSPFESACAAARGTKRKANQVQNQSKITPDMHAVCLTPTLAKLPVDEKLAETSTPEICPICRCDLTTDEPFLQLPKQGPLCGHAFHTECLQGFITQEYKNERKIPRETLDINPKVKNTSSLMPCPVCKSPLSPPAAELELIEAIEQGNAHTTKKLLVAYPALLLTRVYLELGSKAYAVQIDTKTVSRTPPRPKAAPTGNPLKFAISLCKKAVELSAATACLQEKIHVIEALQATGATLDTEDAATLETIKSINPAAALFD